MCADAPRGPAPPGSGLRDTPAPCRGSLAQGHTGGPAWEGPARLSVPSGTKSPSAWAGACSPHLHAVRTAPQGMWTRTLQGWSGPGGLPCSRPLLTAPRGRHKLSILSRAPPRLQITHSFGNNFLTKPQVGPLGERLSWFWALAQPHPSQRRSCVAPVAPVVSDSPSGEQESLDASRQCRG